ncbi:MAG: HAD hydrolase-like protein [Helicobacter sp.]|nr:HAD hydrolase-like protein [Helicobacter sp.]
MYKTFLFDLDGTLLDTTEGVLKAVTKTIQKLNLPFPKNEILQDFVGPPMQESFIKHFLVDSQTALEYANLFRIIYKDSLYEAKLYNGISELLKELKRKKFQIAVATNKSHENAMSILDKFNILSLCDFAMGSDLEGKLKKEDIINTCIKQLCADKKSTLLIGDSIADSNGALRAGIDFIAVIYGFGFKSQAELKNIKHLTSCGSVKELKNYLLNKKDY